MMLFLKIFRLRGQKRKVNKRNKKGYQLKDASNQSILVQLWSVACIILQMRVNMAMDKLCICALWMRMLESIAAW